MMLYITHNPTGLSTSFPRSENFTNFTNQIAELSICSAYNTARVVFNYYSILNKNVIEEPFF